MSSELLHLHHFSSVSKSTTVACLMVNIPLLLFHLRVLMVLGAGRGPLVNASLRAAKQADRKLRVYAVEKNPNAVVT